MNNITKSKLDSKIVKFQTKIRKNLQLYCFSKDAIHYFCKQKRKDFSDYVFSDFKSKLQRVNFKDDAEIKNIKQAKIVKYGDNLINEESADMVYILNISDFESWLVEMFNLIFINNREAFLKRIHVKDYKVNISIINQSDSTHEIWEKIIEQYLSKKFYKGMDKILSHFLSVCQIEEDTKFKELIGEIYENDLTRNLIIHNNKKVNLNYIKKAGKFSQFKKTGSKIKITEDYLFQEGDNLLSFMQKVRKKIIEIKVNNP